MKLLGPLTAEELEAVRLSLLVAIVAVAGSLVPGVLCGWVLARGRFRGKLALEVLVNLPLVLPPVVTGYCLLLLLGRRGLLGAWLESSLGISIAFTWKGAALASAVMAFPLLVRSIRMAFSAIDPRLEIAARTLGAGRLDAFFSISLPLARHGVVSGCVLAFARSLGEFGATILLAANIPGETRTIPLQIYTELEGPGGLERAGRLALLSVLISTVALLVGEVLERRGRARLLREAVHP